MAVALCMLKKSASSSASTANTSMFFVIAEGARTVQLSVGDGECGGGGSDGLDRCSLRKNNPPARDCDYNSEK